MDNPNPIYYKDLVTPDDSITKLISQLDELIQTYDGAKQKIQGAAADVAKSMKDVSGATEEQRKQIQLATEQSDKLVAEYRDVTSAQWKATQAFAEATAAKKESLQVDKLITQINTSAEGSYNKLSAQYRLNKIRLNEMSAEERTATEEGRKLEAETNAIYQEMKRLQEATGKHQLSVGDYAIASKSLRNEIMSLTQEMAIMKVNGEQNSEEYQRLAQRAGQLKDAMLDAQEQVKAMASDTQSLDATMGAASAARGGLTAYNSALALTGANSETATDTQKSLGATIGIVSGATAVQTALQKESNLMVGIGVVQSKALAKAEAYERLVKIKGTAATKGATVAQKAFNIVAAANPYVLLAIALITVVGALVAFASGSNKASKEQTKLNKSLAAQLDYLEAISEAQKRVSDERIRSIQDELEIAKAQNASNEEIQALEDKIYNERVKAHAQQMENYKSQIAQQTVNQHKLEMLQKTLLQLQQAQAAGKNRLTVDVDLDGKVERQKIDKAIEAVQGQIDNLGRSVDIAVELKTEGADIAKERAVQLAQRRNEARQQAKTETDILRQSQDARIALIQDSYKREQITLKAAANRQIADIKTRLETESNLTVSMRKRLNEQIKAIQTKYYRDLQDLQNEFTMLGIAAIRETEDMQIALMADGAAKQREELRVSYEREFEDINNALATQRDLTETQREEMYKQLELLADKYRKDMAELEADITVDQLNADATRLQLRLDAAKEGSQEEIDLQIALLQKQREIELAENAQAAEDVRQSEADINAKWDAIILKQTTEMTKNRALMLLDAQQELAASEFDLLDRNERQKTQFQLQMEKERLQKILELDAAAGLKMTEQERQTIVNTINAIEKESKRLPYNNLYELLGIGLDNEQQNALNTAISSVKDSIDSIIESWNQAADAALEAANAQVDAAQKALEAQIEARNAGYANEVETAQKELELAKKNQQKAQQDKQKAQQAQARIDTLTQMSSLITASANIWSAMGGIPIVGPALAIASIAAMWGSFALSKVRAAQVAGQTEQYGEGTVELLDGGSHASGNDIDMGYNPKTRKHRRAEGGEFFAVINKRNSRKYRNIIPDVINSFNNGTFADRYQRANENMDGYAFNLFGTGTDVSRIEKDVSAMRKNSDTIRFVDGQGNTIVKYKNLTRKILN